MRLSDEVMRCMTVVLDDDVRSLAPAEEPAPAPAPESAPQEPVEEVREAQEGPEA